ncbi:MAG: methyltransferase domain-containing protein [Theionarchaea archaeon]|nr:MAG: hypothetical protein AYK19_03020 [Theionarchaea archaeon DG-70-1]MBU7029617.1 methyltransferase domain-containing protein [Theionarchaea archaeon]
MHEIDRLLKEKEKRLQPLMNHIIPGRIVEFGCGSGFVLEILTKNFINSTIIGVDKSITRLKVIKENLKNVIPVQADITQSIFRNNTFDTALFVDSLHEVFSLSRKKFEDALQMSYNTLKDNGVLIIHESLRPPSELVDLTFKTEESRTKFLKFAREFRPRKVEYKETKQGVTLDIADALDFLSKYLCPPEEWGEEMGETHFFFTEEEYHEAAQKAGFTIKESRKLKRYKKRMTTHTDIEYTFKVKYPWIQLVLLKKVENSSHFTLNSKE